MSSQENIIELVELESISSSKSIRKLRKRNKISSPPEQPSSPKNEPSVPCHKENIHSLFQVKPRNEEGPPKALPRSRYRNVSENISATDTIGSSILPEDNMTIRSSTITQGKPESKSYRERIRDRFKSVKSKAGTSSQKASLMKSGKLIEQLRQESKNIDAQFENTRSKFNLTDNDSKSVKFKFFIHEKNKDEEKDDNNEEIGTGKEKSMEDLSDEGKFEQTIERYVRPEILCFQVDLSEKECFLFPSGEPLDVSDKVDQVRSLEEEGLYVMKRPKMRTSQLNMIERRLLSLDDKKWFNCQGEIDLLPSPVSKIFVRSEFPEISRKETTIFLPASKVDDMENVVVIKDNILELRILNLQFKHHHLFSVEHIFEQKLKAAFNHYRQFNEYNQLEKTAHRLEALRQVKANMENIFKQSSNDSIENDVKIIKCMQEIKSLRETLFVEGKKCRECLKTILMNWKAIKYIRRENKYINTSIKLSIRREKVNYNQEKEKYDDDFERAFNEILAEKKVEVIQRRKKQHRKSGKKDETNDENYDGSDQGVDDSSDERLYSINNKEIKTYLQQAFQESFKPPGEPILHFTLTSDIEVTKEIDNDKEILRRNTVTSTRVYLKIICNQTEVCKSKPLYLNNDFSCTFIQNFTMKVINIPKHLTVEIIEQPSSLLKRKLGEISLNIPDENISIEKVKYNTVNFEKKDIIHYKHEGVGSGKAMQDLVTRYNLSLDNLEEVLFTSGTLEYKVGWDISQSSNLIENNDYLNNSIPKDIINQSGGINTEKLSEWMSYNNPDPQDPKNSILFEYTGECSNDLSVISNVEKRHFRLSPYMQNLQFCDIKVIDENTRLKLLQLRNESVPEFDGMVVPNRSKEIPPTILSNYFRRIASGEDFYLLDDEEEYEIDKKRNNGYRYLKQVYIAFFQKCKATQNNLTYEDIVDEKYMLHFEKLIKAVISNLVNWFKWEPKITKPLPQLKKSEDEKTKPISNISTKIIIKVKSAVNIPSRKYKTSFDNKTTESDTNKVNSYVEITHNGFTYRSLSALGSNPTWNEELIIPLKSSHTDYLNPDSLSGSVSICIFDENIIENSNMETSPRNLLGYLEIPLAAACQGENLNGAFKLNIPYLLLGYEKEADKLLTKSPKIPNIQVTSKHFTYLNMNVEIYPNIPKLNPSMEELPSNDLPYITDHVTRWNEAYNNSYPSRKFCAFAIDRNGKTTCIIRYIKALEPPQLSTEGFDITADQCARYISLIPFTDFNHFYQNVWLTTNNFMEIMLGSIIDHAIALTCFLLALQLEVWLLLGFGIPYGSTAYVLVKDSSTDIPAFSIYDVVNAEKYDVTDPYCPLQKVYCAINEQNIFANVQRGDTISLMRFDFTRKSDWLPLFDSSIPAPTNSIQTKLLYSDKKGSEQLEIIIDRKIRRKISKMRQLEPTVWNRAVSNHFKNALYSFELNAMYGKSNYEAMMDIQTLLSSLDVRGFVISLPYSSISALVNRMKNLGINNQPPQVEFASAVHIHSYTNQILVVWIFLAYIIKTDT